MTSSHVDVAGPLISIVVPAFNVARFLPATIDSIRAQTEQRWECIVVDDGSEDDTWAVANAASEVDPRIRVMRQPNAGASAARNQGFRASDPRSTWITFMDSDDVWRPHALATLLANADRPGTIGAHGLAELIDEHGEPMAEGTYSARGRSRLGLRGRSLVVIPLDEPTDFDVLINGNVLFPPGLVLARRTAYETVGPFDEHLNGPEDWDMLIRLSRLGALTFVDVVILDYRRHGSNLGARTTVAEQAWLVRCVNFWARENSRLQRRQARRGWRAYQRHVRMQQLEKRREARTSRDAAAGREALLRAAAAWAREVRGFPLPRVRRNVMQW